MSDNSELSGKEQTGLCPQDPTLLTLSGSHPIYPNQSLNNLKALHHGTEGNGRQRKSAKFIKCPFFLHEKLI